MIFKLKNNFISFHPSHQKGFQLKLMHTSLSCSLNKLASSLNVAPKLEKESLKSDQHNNLSKLKQYLEHRITTSYQ